MTQPPLSQAIAQLEDALGVLLLDRDSHQVQLSEAGRTFAEEGRTVLARLDSAVEEARRLGGRSLLRIGFVPYLGDEEVEPFLSALGERQPGIETTVSHGITGEQVKRLRAGEIDIGIFTHSGGYRDLEEEPLLPGDPLLVFMTMDHRLAGKEVVGPDDLAGENLITIPRDCNPTLYDWWLAMIENGGYSFRGVQAAGGTDALDLVWSVAHGEGVCFSTSAMLNTTNGASTRVTVRPIDPPLSAPEVVVAWRTAQPPHMKPLLATVREVARELRRDRGPVASP